MKKLYKFSLLFVGLMAYSAGAVLGQETVDLDVTATVAADISLTKNFNVVFGTVPATSTPIIDPNGTNTDVGSTVQYGKVTISAANSTNLIISWNNTTTLGDGTSATMSFTADVTGKDTDDASTSTDLSTPGGTQVTTSASGDFYVYVGGNLGSLSNQTTGSYSSANANGGGPITISVIYQ